MSYHRFKSRDESNEYGSFETFHLTAAQASERIASEGPCAGATFEEGWYWWACFPGCMPDGDPAGPFKTEQEAIDNAQENA
jgi:hypothetical protein